MGRKYIKFISLVLAAVCLMTLLSGCVNNKKDSAKAVLSPESAVEIYMANKDLWMENPEYMPMQGYGYCLLDLDFDGVLELINSINDGSGRYSYNKFYKINIEEKKIEEFSSPLKEMMAEIDYYAMSHTSKLLKNVSDGRLFYSFKNHSRVSVYEGSISYSESYMKDGTLYEHYLFSEYWGPDYENNYKDEIRIYYFQEQEVSKSEYDEKVKAYYAENTDMNLTWKCIMGDEFDNADETNQRKMLLEAYKNFSYEGFSFNDIKTYDIK